MQEVFGAVLSIRENVSGVMKQAKDSTTGYRGEVEKTKKELEKLDKQKIKEKELRLKNSAAYQAIEGVKKKLKPVAEKAILLKAKEEEAVAKIKTVKSHLDKIATSKVVQFGVKGAGAVTKAVAGMALVGTAAAFTMVAGASTKAITQAVEYQSQMQNVGTLLDGDVQQKLKSMSAGLKQVSIDTGMTTTDLTDGLYQVVSAFGESAESTKQLEIAAKAAKAGNATTTDSINLLSAVTKGYGDTSADAMQKVSDLSFMTVKLGQTSFQELAASMGQVVPLASTLKVSQEELFGAMSTLTGVTGSTSEVTTQLKATMQGFLAPSSEMEKTLKKMGYASGAAALESEGLEGILGKLKDSVNGDEVAFANLFSSVEAKNAVLALTGNQAENFASKTKQMYEASGAADQAFKTQTASVKEMAAKLKNAGSVMLTSLGEKALPHIQTAVEGVVNKLPQITEVLSGVVDKAGPMFDGVASTISSFATLSMPLVKQVATIMYDGFMQALPAVKSIKDSFAQIVPVAAPAIASIVGVVSSAIPIMAEMFSGFSSVVAAVMPVVSDIIQDVSGMIQGAFSNATKSTGVLKQIFSVAGPAISKVMSTMWSVIGPIIDLALQGVGLVADAVGFAFPYIEGIVSAAWKIIEPIVSGIGKGIGVVADAVKKLRGVDPSGDGNPNQGGSTSGVSANATGTSFFKGGWTTVGEHGPELMQLPTGTKIKSHSDSINATSEDKRYMIQINHMEVRNDSDIDRIAEEIVRRIEEAEDNE